MKNFCSLLMIINVSAASAQSNTSVVTSGGRIVGVFDNIHAAVVPVIKPDDIAGSPFLSDEWNKGTVVFRNGKRVDSILLKFDIAGNRLIFLQDSLIMFFMEEVFYFIFSYKEGSSFKTAYFKNTYPDEGAASSVTFYQVFAEGSSYHLLKLLKRTINEEYVYNGPAKRRYTPQDKWYVYDVKLSQLFPINTGKASVVKKLKPDAVRIEELCKKNKWDLKSADELTALFKELNNE